MAAPDFEMPGDANRDNVHDITVTASDGDNSANHNVAITVTNENDNVPAFTSPATVSVAENQVAAYEAAAADADGDPLRYSLSGTDAALFTIDANTGEVRFMAAPDFEAPGDADRDNVHDITVTASDGDNSANHNVAITVTNENDNPRPSPRPPRSAWRRTRLRPMGRRRRTRMAIRCATACPGRMRPCSRSTPIRARSMF